MTTMLLFVARGSSGLQSQTGAARGNVRRWFTRGGFAPLKAATLETPTAVSSPAVEHPAFEVVRDEMVDEYGVRATMYKHVKSGAEVLSVVADDENKVGGWVRRRAPSSVFCPVRSSLLHCPSHCRPPKLPPPISGTTATFPSFIHSFTH